MRLLVLASFASLVACSDKSDDSGTDTGSVPVDTSDTSDTGDAPVDADGDGFVAGEDCDDANAQTFPGAIETCNQLDDDCDGTRDEDDAVDAPTWYADADRDGAGDDSATTRSCLQPPDSASVGGDCDDTDASFHPGADESDCTDPNDYNCDGSVGYADMDGDGVAACQDCDDDAATTFPGAEETCNGVDDDCDAEVDEAGATGEVSWWADADVDRYGDPATTVMACDAVAPPGYVRNAGDCDDASAATNPEAPEVCGGADEDCDGTTDEDDAIDAATWYADTDGDGFGDEDSARSACLVPAGFVADASDCDDTAALTNPAGTEVCGGGDEDCDGTTDEDDASDAPTWFADVDGDGFGDATAAARACRVPTGFVADATDCGDGDALVNPAGTEVCGGVDEDCDGTTDEDDASDAPTWYLDADADGFGDAATTDVACLADALYVADATDCDDAHAAAYPGGIETCDGALDENCDGRVDEGTAVDAPTWYADADTDGYGALSTAVNACQVPANHVADATDCDDTAAGTNPGADEVCAGGDEDCDGVANEGDAIDATAWYPDADGDGYGGNSYVSYLCYTPVGHVTNRLDCDDTSSATNPAAPEVCGGGDEDCDGSIDEAGANGETAWYADADGDGYAAGTTTLACSGDSATAPATPDCDDAEPGAYPGATEVCGDLLDNDCVPSTDCDAIVGAGAIGDATLTLAGLLAADRLGNAVTMGDLSGDGIADLVVGGNGIDAGATNLGQVYVWYGPVSSSTPLALTATAGARTPDLTITGSETSMNLASTAVDIVPDIDGDGMNELLVGAFEQNQTSPAVTDPGYAYLFRSVSTTSATATAAATGYVQGTAVSDYVGWALSGVGDVNGDGDGDFIIGGHQIGGSDAGRAGVFSGASFGTGGRAMPSTAGDGYTILTGATGNDYVGYAVDGAGDVDGDGFDDVLVGAPNTNSSSAPLSYVLLQYGGEDFFGASLTPAGGAGSTAADVMLTAGAAGDRLGISVSGLGDVTGDGYDDIGLGADYADFGGSLNKGRVYVITGRGSRLASATAESLAAASFVGSAADDYFGRTVQSAGDVNGDGVGDMWIGATATDFPANGAGTAYLYYGPVDATVGSVSFAAIRGAVAADAVGGRIAPGADLDNDGYDDALLGVPAWDTSLSVQNNGGVFLFFGNGE